MSNPNEVPRPQQPGAQPPTAGNVPPSGSEPPGVTPPAPGGYDVPGYQAPPQQEGQGYPPQGYEPQPGAGQPPAYQGPQGYQPPPDYQTTPDYQAAGRPRGGFRFEMPTDRPQNFNDAMPRGGFSGMFTVTGMPTELKVSYWIWLIGGLLGLLGGVIGLFGSFVLLAVAPGLGFVVFLLVLVALALAAAQVILSMKMKEGREWARFALTIVAGISLLLAILNASAAEGRGGGSWPSFIVSLAAVVLMWMPNSQAWFASLRGRS
ncbi:hypothetical protein J2X01_001926 [Arthrobacter ginsengisoli]|uniref:Integral membrane protein n=1 Tax=Arthrobacter ginsengisoli TaxID=1356565 RepID=A0ABU1UBT9_9MICC|nr:hypothetical protein [Arthrobacter ginsengisoli]MDR7082637.1 hypothetical protein [Arthrobacter ginsengisoli]